MPPYFSFYENGNLKKSHSKIKNQFKVGFIFVATWDMSGLETTPFRCSFLGLRMWGCVLMCATFSAAFFGGVFFRCDMIQAGNLTTCPKSKPESNTNQRETKKTK